MISVFYFLENLLTIQIITTSTASTAKIPIPNPALKIPFAKSQLVNKKEINNKIVAFLNRVSILFF
jgi:galactitol-specific phosphotransferase system IIB component